MCFSFELFKKREPKADEAPKKKSQANLNALREQYIHQQKKYSVSDDKDADDEIRVDGYQMRATTYNVKNLKDKRENTMDQFYYALAASKISDRFKHTAVEDRSVPERERAEFYKNGLTQHYGPRN